MRFSVVFQAVADDVYAVVYRDVYAAEAFKRLCLLVKIRAVAVKIRRVLPQHYVSYEPLDVFPDAVVVGGFVGMHYMDNRFLLLLYYCNNNYLKLSLLLLENQN